MNKLSIIIPAYNEEDNVRRGVLDEVEKYLNNRKYDWEVIVVDDGSGDQTASLIDQWMRERKPSSSSLREPSRRLVAISRPDDHARLPARQVADAPRHDRWKLIRNVHNGKAKTVKTGVLASTGDAILFTDFDQATPLSEVEKLLPFLRKGEDVVIGSREVKGSERLREPWYRHAMGKGFNMVVQLVAIGGIHDTQCGFKLFKAHVAKDLFNSLAVYAKGKETSAFTGAFDVELLYIAQKRRYKIAEVPVSWKYVKTIRVNPLRDSVRMFVDVVRIRMTDLIGGYK